MKKAIYVLFALLGLFLALIVGVFIGRHSISGMMILPEIHVEQAQATEENTDTDVTIPEETPVSSGKININTASVSLLQTLPNIGQVLAQRIVDYRTENGNYTAPEDLLLVEGIGEKRLEQIREYITVGG